MSDMHGTNTTTNVTKDVKFADPLKGWCNHHQGFDCGGGDSPSRHNHLEPTNGGAGGDRTHDLTGYEPAALTN